MHHMLPYLLLWPRNDKGNAFTFCYFDGPTLESRGRNEYSFIATDVPQFVCKLCHFVNSDGSSIVFALDKK